MMRLIDTHAHINQIDNLSLAMDQAAQAGVSDIIGMSVDLQSMEQLRAIAKTYQFPKVHVALGVHPGLVKPEVFESSIAYIREHLDQAVAVGETGLDYWYKWVRSNEQERDKQKLFFQAQLDLAKEFNKPVVIHSRGAWRDCLALAKSHQVTKALFHWYSGPLEYLTGILDAGYYVSTSIALAYSEQSRQAMLAAPLDRILIETDSPVFYKNDDLGFHAQPKDVKLTLEALAQLKGLPVVEVNEIVLRNAKEFFNLDE
jgi:TatD DNase family protein